MKHSLLFIFAVTVLLSFSLASTSFAQSFKANSSTNEIAGAAEAAYTLDINAIHAYVQRETLDFPLSLSFSVEHDWTFNLTRHDIRSDAYHLVTSDGSIYRTEGSPAVTYKGTIDGQPDSQVRMTIADSYFRALIQEEGQDPIFVDLIEASPSTATVTLKQGNHGDYSGYCSSSELHRVHEIPQIKSDKGLDMTRSVRAPYETEIAFAVDYEAFKDFSSVDELELELLTILNYTDAYYAIHDLTYRLTQTYVVTELASQPWDEKNDAGQMLDEFTSWASQTNELDHHDVITLWTGINFGSTIGIAWVNAIGSSYRQNVVNFVKGSERRNANIHAHELGHNWGSDHVNSGGWMMSAYLSSANDEAEWHTNTINAFPGFVQNAMDHLTDVGGQDNALPINFNDLAIGTEANNNDYLDPGETATLHLIIDNQEDVAIENMVVTMSNDNNRAKNHVTINTETVDVGRIEANASVEVPFSVTLSTAAPFSKTLRFLYQLTDGTRETEFTASILSGDQMLPVDLVSFDVFEVDGGIQLRWQTASEQNNAGFEIEQQFNGGTFERIAMVDGAGTTIEQQDYIFTIQNPDPGAYAFRLRQIDFDGTFELSDEVSITLLPQAYKLAQNYPNPFNPQTRIAFQLPVAEDVLLEVYDMLGRRIAVLVDRYMGAGQHAVNFDAADLPNGTYLYKLRAGAHEEMKPMILLK